MQKKVTKMIKVPEHRYMLVKKKKLIRDPVEVCTIMLGVEKVDRKSFFLLFYNTRSWVH